MDVSDKGNVFRMSSLSGKLSYIVNKGKLKAGSSSSLLGGPNFDFQQLTYDLMYNIDYLVRNRD